MEWCCRRWSWLPDTSPSAVLVAVIWGVNFVAIDLGLRDTPPLVLVALRFALVAVPLVFFVRRPDVPWRVLAGIGLFMSAGQFGLLFTAMHLGLPAGLAAVVLQCQMIFTLVIAAFVLRERPTRLQLLGALVGVAGLGIVAVGRLEADAEAVNAAGGDGSPRWCRCSSASARDSAGGSATSSPDRPQARTASASSCGRPSSCRCPCSGSASSSTDPPWSARRSPPSGGRRS